MYWQMYMSVIFLFAQDLPGSLDDREQLLIIHVPGVEELRKI